jgi:UDPglucose--hexose-1-phosphate uridylyltransferase
MKKNKKEIEKYKFPSELRFDLVSKDWVVIATGRAKRPEEFKKEERKREIIPKKDCPFCNINTQKEPTLVFLNGKNIPFTSWKDFPKKWSIVVVPNKYPAFNPEPCLEEVIEGGLFKKMNAVGFHEVVITYDHRKQIPQFSLEQTKELFDVYQRRYLDLMNKEFVNHISIFHNHGPKAGASVFHPHSQIITTPLVDVDLRKSLLNSKLYSNDKKECIYCRMNKWELKTKKRLVFENKDFLAICPFASKAAFEVIVSPKKHLSYFERITENQKWNLTEAFLAVMKKIYKGLNDPDYNFYLHSAPCDGLNHDYYHWHWTLLPKTSIWAGFELGTRIEISTIEPEKAAEYLRKQ